MEIFLKAVCSALICTVISLVLAKQCKDFSVVLILFVVCLVITAAIAYLKPVVELVDRLVQLGDLNVQLLSVLLKAVGISMVSEITSMVCADAGAGSIGKSLQILAMSVILWLSIPLFNELIDLAETILNYA